MISVFTEWYFTWNIKKNDIFFRGKQNLWKNFPKIVLIYGSRLKINWIQIESKPFEGVSPYDVVSNIMNCGNELSEFEFQLSYNVLFWTYNLKKVMDIHIPIAIDEIEHLLFEKNCFIIQ